MIVLAELSPLDTVAGTRKLLRACSANDPAVTGLNDQIWRPAISGEAQISIRLFKGDFDGEAAPSGGSLSVQIDQWLSIEPSVRRFVWQGAPVKLYAGVSGQAWPWTVVFEGLVDQFNAEANTVKLNLKVNTEPFDADVLTLKYAGTGGAEGDTNLKDKVKPFLLGRCLSVEPIMINAVDNVLQFSGYGAIQAVNALYERGSDFGASIGNYATYNELVAASIPPGQWATCLSAGLVRLGAPPYGVITGDVDGDNVGGTWWRKTGEIIQRIASNAGVSGSLIESASFTALDTALAGLSNQGRIGVYIDSQETVLQTASKLAAKCNAQVGVSLLGKMFVIRVAIGSPTITLDAQQRQLPRVNSSTEVSVQPPFSYIEMGYARAWRVHTDDEITTETSPEPGATRNVNRGEWSGASVAYAVGDFVQRNGSSYSVITAHTSTADNGPPGANWALLAAQGTAGTPGTPGAAGTPGAPGAPGANGTPGITGYLTNESVQLWSYANGGVVSYAPATGSFSVFSGNVDVSASFSLSTLSNPQGLTVGYSGQTYSVSGGFDPNEDTASLTIRATGSGNYAGVTIDKVFSLAKAWGGFEIFTELPTTNNYPGRTILLDTDGKLYRYVLVDDTLQWTRRVDGADLEAGSVTADAIAAGAITAAKINVTSLSAISAIIGLLRTATTGQRVEISNDGIRVFYSNNVPAVTLGIWDDDA